MQTQTLDEILDALLEPSDDDLKNLETVNVRAWKIVVCRNCKSKIDITKVRWPNGYCECPYCKHLN